MRYVRFFLFFLMTLAAMPAPAVEPGYPIATAPLDFGTIIQTPNTVSTVVLDTGGLLVSISGATSAGGYSPGEIRTQKSAGLRSETITLSGYRTTFGSCNIDVNIHTFFPVTFTDTGTFGGVASKWGATATIPANCKDGVYHGTADILATGSTQEKQPLPIRITIQAPLTLTKLSDLDFGEMLTSASGRVYIAANGTRTALNVTLMGSTASAANFQVNGLPGTNVNITHPAAGQILITRQGGSETMSVANFTLTSGSVINLGLSGSATFGVGATLAVIGSPPVGVYTGTFQVTVSY